MNPIQALLGTITEPVVRLVEKHTERKMAQESASAKLKQAKVDNQKEVVLKEAEIEAVRTQGLETTWKDEYVTVSVMTAKGPAW